jgi:serine/threonine protein kinase
MPPRGVSPATPRDGGDASPPPSDPYKKGDLIAGQYRLDHRLGRGGMGDVWRAHNETLDIDVALKLIRGASDDEAALRLHQEARAAAKLGHPAIVRIFDFGRTDHGEPFIVMELLEGEDLASTLAERGRLSAAKAVRILLPIVDALWTAHSKGIVHRDVKPENVFIARGDDGRAQPKIVDFGVAKLEKQVAGRLTQAGALIGSPAYMSPEQARGEEADARADVWALSVLLYEMVTAVQPFTGPNHNAILLSIQEDSPKPITELAAGDDELWGILAKGLAKNRAERWQSMRVLGQALASWLLARGITEDIVGGRLGTTWHDPVLGEAISAPPPRLPPARSLQPTVHRTRSLPAASEADAAARGRKRLIVVMASAVFLGAVLGAVFFGGTAAPASSPVVAAPGPVAAAPAAPVAAAPPVAPSAAASPSSAAPGATPAEPKTSAARAPKAASAPRAAKKPAKSAPRPTFKDPFR